MCVCIAQRVANLLHATPFPATICAKSQLAETVSSLSLRRTTCSCDQWLRAVPQVVLSGPCSLCLKTRLPCTLPAQLQTGDRRAMNKFLRSFYNKFSSWNFPLISHLASKHDKSTQSAQGLLWESSTWCVSSVQREREQEAACILILIATNSISPFSSPFCRYS